MTAAGSARSETIYLYEDDEALAQEIVAAFAVAGHEIVALDDERDLISKVAADKAAALVIDRMIDGRDSLALVEALRAKGRRIPVLVISSLATVYERIRGLKAGGDDYLVKPFAMDELVVRVEALCRRATTERPTRLVVDSLTLDLIERTARRGTRDIALQPREFGLLEYLMRHAGLVVTRAMLLEDVWNYRLSTQTNVVDVHIGNLRRKIDGVGEPRLITSVRGLGFRLAAPGPDD